MGSIGLQSLNPLNCSMCCCECLLACLEFTVNSLHTSKEKQILVAVNTAGRLLNSMHAERGLWSERTLVAALIRSLAQSSPTFRGKRLLGVESIEMFRLILFAQENQSDQHNLELRHRRIEARLIPLTFYLNRFFVPHKKTFHSQKPNKRSFCLLFG